MQSFDRRTVLRTAGALVASAALAPTLAREAVAATAARTDIGVSVFAFPLGSVRLQSGPFLDNMNRQLAYFRFVDADRLLHTFRLTAGLSTSAQACGGWETPTTELRGHSTGHLLTGLAQAYANTGDTQYKTKGDYLVTSLAACQARSPQQGFHTGYLSAYPENFFDRLESGQSVWAPYYTLHKIMAGLLDQYLLAGNQQALDVLLRKAAWVKTRTDPLSTSQMQQTLRTEFGGMPEVLTNLYQLTGTADHLATAQRFDHAQILDPLAANQDRLSGFHANTQIPKILGAIREYHATGNTRYRDIAVNFWRMVIDHHTYVIGGNSNGEYFQTPDAISTQLSDSTCEVCNTYNMLKLTRQLFFTNPSAAEYMDYYESALYNQILGEQDPSSGHGFVTYYNPLRAGGIKTYSNDYNSFTCDHGTGMESQTKFADSIYFHAGETLYVNLFVPSVLTWPGRNIAIRQDTTYPSSPTTRLTVTGSGHIALKIRIPRWTSGAVVRVNGTPQNVAAGAYATIDRTWASGDVVEVAVPATLTFPRANDNASIGAVRYGAIVLAGQYGSTDLNGTLPTLQTNTLVQDSTNPLRFTGTASTGAVTLLPYYVTHHQRYTVYWRMGSTPAGTSYEAEATANTLGGQAVRRNSSGASGGAVVGYVGNGTANYLQFNNVTATAGTHAVTVYYASGDSRSLSVSANGGTATTVTAPSTGGWDTPASVTVTLTLVAGTNTIRIGNASGWAPDIDRIVVS
ncbi:beta-L-arabinofuranosidase domain-containing protein [Actinophytocola oryzae]|uniref:CBM6 domain-containing protein n=1 Tax=Actinophytocola oryzae TaxID=502181 RepID=A0A4R7UZ46_9PSEU|nr:beta-L-arabinofuranosidase domain-containing protein [Actinophytocola oryzae]TDV42203.1 hypothetical protein CLV71_11873 [Actinophytocola oryzae]